MNPALAARCLLESGEEADAARTEQSQADLLARLGSVAIHVRSRIEAGLLLGRLGDPRFAVETVNGVAVILPPMVEIAGGEAEIGSEESDDLADSDEKPRHTVTLAPYAIGQFPGHQRRVCLFHGSGRLRGRAVLDGGRALLAARGEKVPGEAEPADWSTWSGGERFKADHPGDDPISLFTRLLGNMTKADAETLAHPDSWERRAGALRQDAQEEWYPDGAGAT